MGVPTLQQTAHVTPLNNTYLCRRQCISSATQGLNMGCTTHRLPATHSIVFIWGRGIMIDLHCCHCEDALNVFHEQLMYDKVGIPV